MLIVPRRPDRPPTFMFHVDIVAIDVSAHRVSCSINPLTSTTLELFIVERLIIENIIIRKIEIIKPRKIQLWLVSEREPDSGGNRW